MKLFEMFAGYGGASFALKKAGIDFECVGYSEIDKYAIQCYKQNHKDTSSNTPTTLKEDIPYNYGDCTKINPKNIQDFDLLTGGFPCQSFSIAGKGKGEQDTRGTLFHEIIRIAEVKKPRYMLLENVKGLTFKPHKKTFEKILSELRRIGYYVKWKVLNSKEHGIPQNRERIFFFCFRDKQKWKDFRLPRKVELKIVLRDILEEEVEEKYYLNSEQVKRLISRSRSFNERMCKEGASSKIIGNVNPSGRGMNGNVYVGEVSPTITTNKGEGPKIIDIYNNKVKDICPTLSDHCHNNLRLLEPKKEIKPQTMNPFGEPIPNIPEIGEADRIYNPEKISHPVKASKINIIQLNNPKHSSDRIYSDEGCSPTLQASMGLGGGNQPFIAAQRSWPRKGTKAVDGERHQMLEPKFDGTTNTLSSVQKDNLVVEPAIIQRGRGYNKGGIKEKICPAISSSSWENNNHLVENYIRKHIDNGGKTTEKSDGTSYTLTGSGRNCGSNQIVGFDKFRIRKLTPKECFRLMGFLNDEINLEGISNTQRYKLAGNGWDINLVSKLFKQMFK